MSSSEPAEVRAASTAACAASSSSIGTTMPGSRTMSSRNNTGSRLLVTRYLREVEYVALNLGAVPDLPVFTAGENHPHWIHPIIPCFTGPVSTTTTLAPARLARGILLAVALTALNLRTAVTGFSVLTGDAA